MATSASGDDADTSSHAQSPHTGPALPGSQRIRFSSEIERAEPAAADTLPESSSSLSSSAAVPPAASRSRNRGYSLRRQLFFRNASANADSPLPTTATTTANDGDATVSNPVEMVQLTQSPSPESTFKPLDVAGGAHAINAMEYQYAPKKKSAWKVKARAVGSSLNDLRKKVFGPRELGHTKNGRRIPMGALREKGDLVDERTGHGYCSNTVSLSGVVRHGDRMFEGCGDGG